MENLVVLPFYVGLFVLLVAYFSFYCWSFNFFCLYLALMLLFLSVIWLKGIKS